MPSWIEIVRARLDAPDDVVEEIAHQLEHAFEEARQRGVSEAEARDEAMRQVPDWRAFARAVESARTPPTSERRVRAALGSALWQDVRYGVRGLVANPGFAILASLALALGIGANTVAFTFVQSLLLQKLPVEEPDELVRIYSRLPDSFEYASLSFADYGDIRAKTDLFSGVLVDKLVPLNLGSQAGGERVWGYMVSGRYFSVLGVPPVHGRFFDYADEGSDGQYPVAVLSYGFWQRAFGGSPAVLGETLLINGHPFEVIGIAPESFIGTATGLSGAVWLPASMSEFVMPGFELRNRRNRSFFSVARLRPGIDLEQARSGLDVLAKQLELEYPESNRGIGLNVLPEADGGIHPIMRGGFIGFSGVLVIVVMLVLLLACANVAGLLLSRAAYRQREIGLRLALGATRGRLVRQLLTESLLLSLVALGVGLVVATWCAHFLSSLGLPTDLPLSLPMALDGRVVGFAFLVSLLTAILFGLVPALQSSRSDLVSSLKATGGVSASRRSRLRSGLVAGQVALSTVLLVGAGLFVRGLQSAHQVDLGFDPEGLVVASVDLGLQGYESERGLQFYDQLGERVRALPAVQSVGWVNMIPFAININTNSVAPEGFEPTADGGTPSINRNVVSRDYFDAMRTRIVGGRGFTDTDDVDAPAVVMVNETLAARFWPGENAVGKRMGRPGGTMMEVVGVVEDGKYLTLGEDPKSFFFYPLKQRQSLEMTLVVRAQGEPGALLERIREEVRAMDAGLPVYDSKPMEEHLRIALVPARVGASLLGSFAILALGLAAVGLYGMLAFAVAQQRFEIGLRRALGARGRDILAGVLRQGMRLALFGVGIGLVLSVGLGRLTASLLYGIEPVDPLVFGLAALVLVGTALLASYVPARRATQVDPIVALRSE